MQTYETLFIASPTLTEDVERETVETLSQIVAEGGGTMVANDRMGTVGWPTRSKSRRMASTFDSFTIPRPPYRRSWSGAFACRTRSCGC